VLLDSRDAPGLAVSEVTCPGGAGPDDHARPGAWSAEEAVGSPAVVVLVRRGVFQRRVDGVETVLDATTGYLQRSGEVERFAHPAGGDVCTSIRLPADALDRLWHSPLVPVGPDVDLAHRRLHAAATAGRPPAVRADLASELVAALVPGAPVGPDRQARAVAGQVRLALADAPGMSLTELAAAVGFSPWYLSRLFHRATGSTISRYRAQLRARAVLDALAGPERSSLAGLAAAHGYADQAHLTRDLRRHTGLTPSALRTLLTG
jgi:AraC-like DNA-binding protein